MARCESCGASIEFLLMPSGKDMPVDEAHNPEGTVIVTGDRGDKRTGRVLTREELTFWPKRALFMSHFVTCPAANKHRKRRTA